MRLHNPDEHWELVRRLMRLGKGKFYLCWGDDVDDFLDDDKLGQVWEDALNGNYGFLNVKKDEVVDFREESPLFRPMSHLVLAAGEELRSWANEKGLPVFSSFEDLTKVSRCPSFKDTWRAEESGSSVEIGRNGDRCESWNDVLTKPAKKHRPKRFNSALLFDNHLFVDQDLKRMCGGYSCFGSDNLKSLISGFGPAFRPQNLLVCCGVTMNKNDRKDNNSECWDFVDTSRKDWGPKACINETGLVEIHRFLKAELRDVGFTGELELVGMREKGMELHERTLLTNHHFLRSDKGFRVFHQDKIHQGELSFDCVLHDLEFSDEYLSSELVSNWRKKLKVLQDVMYFEDETKRKPLCVGANGRFCSPSALRHPFLIPLNSDYHDH
ncbi:hypothetical protein N9L83_00385 [Flavobacteriales bacterium]|nr:hypothetical protein [Flavobacteriales bacterium]